MINHDDPVIHHRRSTRVLTDACASPEAVGAKNLQGQVCENDQRYSANSSPLPPRGTQPGSLGAIVQNFKLVSTRKINQTRRTPGLRIWQRGYYDRILRDERELDHARESISMVDFMDEVAALSSGEGANPK